MKNDYFEKKEARLERFKTLAGSNEKLSISLANKSNEMASVIPMGQPILVGHHSEKRDRNYRNKIHNTMASRLFKCVIRSRTRFILPLLLVSL